MFGVRAGGRSGDAAVLRSPESLVGVLDALPSVVLMTDREGGIVYRNRAATVMAQATAAAHGEAALEQLRAVLKRLLSESTSFPTSDSADRSTAESPDRAPARTPNIVAHSLWTPEAPSAAPAHT